MAGEIGFLKKDIAPSVTDKRWKYFWKGTSDKAQGTRKINEQGTRKNKAQGSSV